MEQHERSEFSDDEAMKDAAADTLKTPDADEEAARTGEHGPRGTPPDGVPEEPVSDASADTLKAPRGDQG